MKAVLVGPFPDPVTGVSFANQALKQFLSDHEVKVYEINTISKLGVSSKGGDHFSLIKMIEFLLIYLRAGKILRSDVAYFTPGQTFYGVAKYAPFIFLCRLFNVPYIIHLHGNYLGKEYQRLKGGKRKIFAGLIGRASAGIVLSESLKKNFKGLLPENKVYIVKNFVSEDLVLSDISSKSYQRPVILYLSNLMREKGIFEFLDALEILDQKSIDYHAIVAGGIETGLRDLLLERMEKNRNIRYEGIVKGEKKKAIFLESNIFVFPTYYTMEGQPIAILEAMATANIPIVTPHAGIPDILSEQEAVFIRERSAEDLADKLLMVGENLTGFSEMLKNNLERVKNEFRLQQFGEAVNSLLKDHARPAKI